MIVRQLDSAEAPRGVTKLPNNPPAQTHHGGASATVGATEESAMRAGEARAAAADWIVRYAQDQPGFRGAYIVGSTVALAGEDALPLGSDVDVAVVTNEDSPQLKEGKVLYQGVLLEIIQRLWSELSSADEVSSAYHLAHGLRVDTIISDPTGDLRSLQKIIGDRFREESWVRRRCQNAREKVERGLSAIDPGTPWHDQVTGWLFPTGVTTHILLVAALRNPTVRLRYLAARQVLADYRLSGFYPELLGMLGCAELTQRQAEEHLAALEGTFDAAAAVARTRFFFSSDITPAARPIAIDATRKLIQAGNHREAVFWLVATSARCHKILAFDALRATQRAHAATFDALLADLGIESTAGLLARASEVHRRLPDVWGMAETIIATNPEISHSR